EDAEPLPASVPAPLRWIIERLLSKDPADRYDSTRDLYRELRQVRDRLSETVSGVQAASTASFAAPAATPALTRNRRFLLAALAFAVIGSAAGWFLMQWRVDVGRLRYMPMEVSWENPSDAVWSPDGTGFAYVAGAAGDRHVFVRYLNSPTPVMLTRTADDWYTAGWSPDAKRVFARGKYPQGRYALFSVPVFGGDPVFVMQLDTPFMPIPRISDDGRSLVAVGYTGLKLGVYTSSPVGSPLQRYTPEPFEARALSNSPTAAFGPDGTWITLIQDVIGGRQVWKLPFPPGKAAPERIMKGLNSIGPTPRWSWFPNSRYGFISSTDEQGAHLWFAGVRNGPKWKLTGTTPSESETQPMLSPDGKRMLFVQGNVDYMIVSASLSDATVTRVISSEMQTGMPAWARQRQEFAYESRRNGSPTIWVRNEGTDRPIVTPDIFPPGTSLFASPALSPGADRVVYTRGDDMQRFQNWISAVSGGPPVRMTNEKEVVERGGAWSPDGTSIVYWEYGSVPSIRIVKSTGEATPVTLRQSASNVPDWSPDGQWISFRDGTDEVGWGVISPDGKTVRSFGEPQTIQVTFSPDSKRLYGIRVEPSRCVLYSIDIASKEKKIIGEISKDFTPASYSNPAIRLSVSPDGKSILYPAIRRSNSLWMLEGFDQPGWVDGLRELIP
ncbi:MAG TPA: hypothetical protein VKR43_16740, partial [Bryobacteraceae bacterium]|nr:hypothetical protein [Bryobacteraceae bacterium]